MIKIPVCSHCNTAYNQHSENLPIQDDYLHENVRDGKEGLCIFGNPKQGKSNTANRLCKDDMLYHDRNLIMPGDVNCEFRNLLFHADRPVKEYDIIVPHDCEFEFANLPHAALKHIKKVDYSNDLILEDFLKGKKRKLLVIYDDHLDDLVYWKRLEVWNDVAKQLIRRTFDLKEDASQRTIIFRFDEGGAYFPEIALGPHYKMIYRFNYLNVAFRKNHVQVMLLSQLDSEMKSTIHNKQNWRLLKKGAYSKRIPKLIRKQAPFFSRVRLSLFNGGIYNPEINIRKMHEAPQVWKMVPLTDYNDKEMNGNNEKDREKYVREYLKFVIPQIYDEWSHVKGFTKAKLAKMTGIPRTTVSDWIKNFELGDDFSKIKATAEAI